MVKKGINYLLLSLLACLVMTVQGQGNLNSPSEFFGYEYGTQMPTFMEINQYFHYLAENSPQAVLIQYGQTYERRPLVSLILSSEANLSKLESVRENHIKGMWKNVKSSENDPLVLWLSYGVHGNEAGATSTAPEAAYQFLTSEKELLEDAIILMDPCVNPDGFARYTGWYNQTVSNPADSRREVLEHNEPWPSGRVNHYLFDLNRDWLWLSQVESQSRLSLYRQWMPHLHIDFHEQYPDAWYFFPPPAEPVHPYVTKFQRAVQDSFGLSNAREFDERGWPYYTQEWFDLYYPSYGDTYPLFTGAIGMTYEQGGHGRAGLIYELSNGDSLRLKDRIEHHLTTGITSVKRSVELKEEIQDAWNKFFKDGRENKVKSVEAYAIICESEKQREKLRNFFSAHQIETRNLPKGSSLNGYSYRNNGNSTVKSGDYGLYINCRQAQSRLIHVMMEPENVLSEKKTYDITAWAIPYMWGLEAVALKTEMKFENAESEPAEEAMVFPGEKSLGYKLIYKTLDELKEVAQLLQKGYKIRSYKAEGDMPYFLILTADNKNADKVDLSGDWKKIQSGSSLDHDLGSHHYSLLKKPEILLVHADKVSSDNYGFTWHYFERELGYPLHRLGIDRLEANMYKYNTIIFADGYYKLDQSSKIKIQEFIQSGGKVIFMKNAWNIMGDSPEYKLTKRNPDGHNPGSIVRIKLDNEDRMAWGMQDYLDCLIRGNNVYDKLENSVGTIEKWEMSKGYMDEELKTEYENSMRFGYKEIGRGKAIYMLDDPLFRGFWERGKQLFTNAIILM